MSVAVVHAKGGKEYTLNKASFDALLQSAASAGGAVPDAAALQVFIAPKGGKGAVYRNEYSMVTGGRGSSAGKGRPPSAQPLTNTKRVADGGGRGRGGEEVTQSHSQATNAALDEATKRIVHFLQSRGTSGGKSPGDRGAGRVKVRCLRCLRCLR
jgi:hypothetical protein